MFFSHMVLGLNRKSGFPDFRTSEFCNIPVSWYRNIILVSCILTACDVSANGEGEMCPCDFSDILEISVGGVSQHLRKLKDGGIVRDKKVGQTIFYSLVKENMEMIKPILDSLSNQKEPVS